MRRFFIGLCVLASSLVLSLSAFADDDSSVFTEDAYDGSWVLVCDGYEVYLPADMRVSGADELEAITSMMQSQGIPGISTSFYSEAEDGMTIMNMHFRGSEMDFSNSDFSSYQEFYDWYLGSLAAMLHPETVNGIEGYFVDDADSERGNVSYLWFSDDVMNTIECGNLDTDSKKETAQLIISSLRPAEETVEKETEG